MTDYERTAEEAIARLAEDLAEGFKRICDLADQAERYREATGITLGLTKWNMTHFLFEIEATEEGLPAISKVMGRLEVKSMSAAQGKKPGEIEVILQPVSEEWNRFKIRYHKILDGTEPCKIVSSTYEQRKLVCEVK